MKPIPLRLVDPEPSPEQILRAAIQGRDEAAAVVARFDAVIAEQGRIYVRAKGEFMAPTLERLRRDLGL